MSTTPSTSSHHLTKHSSHPQFRYSTHSSSSSDSLSYDFHQRKPKQTPSRATAIAPPTQLSQPSSMFANAHAAVEAATTAPAAVSQPLQLTQPRNMLPIFDHACSPATALISITDAESAHLAKRCAEQDMLTVSPRDRTAPFLMPPSSDNTATQLSPQAEPFAQIELAEFTHENGGADSQPSQQTQFLARQNVENAQGLLHEDDLLELARDLPGNPTQPLLSNLAPAKVIEVVTINSDSEDDPAPLSEPKPAPVVASPAKPAKRPRTSMPDVIDVDDVGVIEELESLARAPQRRRHHTLPTPGGATPHAGIQEKSRLHVSRGGGLFSVDEEGNIEIVDSDDEANVAGRVIREPDGLSIFASAEEAEKAKHIQSSNSLANTSFDSFERVGQSAQIAEQQNNLCASITGAPLSIGKTDGTRTNDGPPVLLHESMDVTDGHLPGAFTTGGLLEEPSRRLSGSQTIAPPNIVFSGEQKAGAHNGIGPAQLNQYVGVSDANEPRFNPVTANDLAQSSVMDPTQYGDENAEDQIVQPGSTEPSLAHPHTKMQIADGHNVRPQFVAVVSPGLSQSASNSEMPTLSLNFGATAVASSRARERDEVEAEGLSAQGLRNLVKQNLLTADATEEAETPKELSVPLMPHQRRALAWMAKREMPFQSDEDIIAVDEQCLGGILADDQGLGKTLTMIALLVKSASAEATYNLNNDDSESSESNVCDSDSIDDSSVEEVTNKRDSESTPWRTLIVCPLSVINQWKEEIESKIKSTNLPKIYVYHGPRRERSARRLATYDIVITTYAVLVNEYPKILKDHPDYEMRKAEKLELPRRGAGPVCRIPWRRVILDESQYIKNRGTDTWSAVMSLQAEKRWCLSGTPIQNCVDDLYSLFCFIRYKFVANYEMWNQKWKKQLEHPDPKRRTRAFQRFQTITGVVLLRRTKMDTINGKPLISLPPRITNVYHKPFADVEEAQVYQAVQEKTILEVNKFIVSGTFSANYSSVLLLLLRLRQACSHPFLIEYARMQGGCGKTQATDPNFATLYTVEELDEAMELCSGGHSLLAMIDENMRDHVTKYFAPPQKGQPVTSLFHCSYCTQVSHWKQGWVLGCGEVFCSGCRTIVEQRKECLRCARSIANLDPVETIINADHLRKEVHAKAMLGTSQSDTNVTAAEFKMLLEEELERRKMGHGETWNELNARQEGGSGMPGRNARVQRRSEEGKRKLVAAFSQHSTKIRLILEELEGVRRRGEGEKTLIFSQWTSMLDIIEFHLKMRGFGTCRLDGTMTITTRQHQIKEFREKSEKKVFLISLHAGGTGLNLTASNRVILTDVWWNPAVEEQAIDRVHRIGQTKAVHVSRFKMMSTVEERIYALCAKKRETAQGTLGEAGKQNYGRTKLTRQEIVSMFSATAEDVIRNAGEGTAAAQAASNLLNFSRM